MAKPLDIRIAEHCEEIEKLHRELGAPGDWGYDTPAGKALAALYRAHSLLRDANAHAANMVRR